MNPVRLSLYALVPLCLLFTGCFLDKRSEVRLTEEPSIERALDLLAGAPEGKPLTKFLIKHPVTFEFTDTPGLCHKFSFKTRRNYLPKEYKRSETLLVLALARSAYIYRLYSLSGLEEVISEEEELGALFQARIGLAINLTNRDFERNRFAGEIQSGFCTYIMEGSRSAAIAARDIALASQPECHRPLETLKGQQAWMEETRKAMDNESFFQLFYERDMRKVKKGLLTAGEAMKNDADIRATPMDELYRYQRMFYDRKGDSFARMEKLYGAALKDDETWRAVHRQTIDAAREEFSACNMPK